uniref:Uncharacterized protein n=1 Tax=Ananas comosus var. bracteatus TaxID=296719 RepID=A0A6V7PDG7_ANACO|nr:unnamed protein product [Ananas comosus var. bracteatus]
MRILTMIIQETLRLYPPGAFVSREALQGMKLGGILVPKGVNVYVPVSTLHHDRNIWGPDAHEFNPERFAGSDQRVPAPPRVRAVRVRDADVPGQNFAMVELKIALSMILSKFAFSLSPLYRHSPALRLIVEPEFGVDLVMRKVQG